MITASNLLGTWSCVIITQQSSCNSYPLGADSIYYQTSGNITFSDDGDGTYSYTTGSLNFLRCGANSTASSYPFVIKNNIFLTKVHRDDNPSNPSNVSIRLKKISDTKILMEDMIHNADSAIFVECDKQNLIPNPPSSLTYANSSSSITLTWTDNQTEAVTGYKVIRKTVVTDDYSTVSTITDNTTRTYADTDVSTGSYWYRVRAYNGTGDGTPSKVVKSEFP